MASTLSVAEHFAPGTKVGVVPRVTDFAPPSSRGAVKTATVDKNGEIKLDGLKDHGQYWLHDGEKAVAYNQPGEWTDLADEQERRAQAQAELRSEHPHLSAPQHNPDNTTTDPGVADHNYEKSDEPAPQPAAKYVDMPKGTPQRVGADIGTAYPVDPAEIQPQPGKQHVKDGTPQRDGADEGYATPVDPGEVQPAVKYEDEKQPQRLGADTGTAYPFPKGSLKEQEIAKSSSESKARGATVPVAGTDKVPAQAPKGAPKASKGQAAKVKEPVTSQAKKTVKKGDS